MNLVFFEKNEETINKLKLEFSDFDCEIEFVNDSYGLPLAIERERPLIIILSYCDDFSECEKCLEKLSYYFPDKGFILKGHSLNPAQRIRVLKHPVLGFLDKDTSGLEIMLMINNLIKFSEWKNRIKDSTSLTNRIELDKSSLTAIVNDNTYSLTSTEFKILSLIINKKGKIVTNEDIRNIVWKGNVISKSAIPTHLNNLRNKVPELKKHIKNKKNLGYIFS